jgi:uncharacterized lipoprotein
MSSIRPNHRNALSRAATIAIMIAMSVAVLGASGCRWFHKKDVYAMSADERPLEFPPAFDATEAERSLATTASGSVTRSSLPGAQPTTPARGFTVPGDRATVFARVGELLAATPGLTIASRAQLLGAFDVDYEGQKFLIRINEGSSGSSVSAVDPRGQPADNAAANKVIAALRAALVKN